MTDKQNPDDRLDELVRAAARDYNRPGPTPRDAMWARIEDARRAARPAPVVALHDRRRTWAWMSVAAAAVLVAGVAIGRYTARGSADSTVVRTAQQAPRSATSQVDTARNGANETTAIAVPEPRTAVATAERGGDRPPRSEAQPERGGSTAAERAADAAPYRLAVAEHLARTEVLLTSFRAEARAGGGAVDPQISTWARDLLRTTRLLQHAQRSADPGMQRLLDDLELVLVQIAQYGSGDRRSEDLELIEQSMDRRGVIPKLRATLPPGTTPAGT